MSCMPGWNACTSPLDPCPTMDPAPRPDALLTPMRFDYVALDSTGTSQRGVEEALAEADAVAQLLRRGLTPLSLAAGTRCRCQRRLCWRVQRLAPPRQRRARRAGPDGARAGHAAAGRRHAGGIAAHADREPPRPRARGAAQGRARPRARRRALLRACARRPSKARWRCHPMSWRWSRPANPPATWPAPWAAPPSSWNSTSRCAPRPPRRWSTRSSCSPPAPAPCCSSSPSSCRASRRCWPVASADLPWLSSVVMATGEFVNRHGTAIVIALVVAVDRRRAGLARDRASPGAQRSGEPAAAGQLDPPAGTVALDRHAGADAAEPGADPDRARPHRQGRDAGRCRRTGCA